MEAPKQPDQEKIQGTVYKVEIGDKFYFGSTKEPLNKRANKHNYKIRNGSKTKFHIECQNNLIYNVKCEEIYKGDDFQEYENKLILENINNPNCLNMKVVKADEERKKQLRKKKTTCQLCDKEITCKNMSRHLKNIHKVSNDQFFGKKVKA